MSTRIKHDGICQDCDPASRYFSLTASYSVGTNKYEGTTCSDVSDCETQCAADGACLGYTNLGPQTIGWGDSDKGGDVPALGSFVEIVSTDEAFAALKSDGSVQVWGSIHYGGADPGLTSGVQKIYSNPVAFAALKTDGSVTTWGESSRGGDAPNIGAGSGITEIFSNMFAFAALKSDGSVTAWGNTGRGRCRPQYYECGYDRFRQGNLRRP